MSSLAAFLASAGTILAAGTLAIQDAIKLVDLIKTVRDKGEPTDSDWQALHDYEAAQTAELDAPMEGEGE